MSAGGDRVFVFGTAAGTVAEIRPPPEFDGYEAALWTAQLLTHLHFQVRKDYDLDGGKEHRFDSRTSRLSVHFQDGVEPRYFAAPICWTFRRGGYHDYRRPTGSQLQSCFMRRGLVLV